MVTNIEFEFIVTSIKKYLFHQIIVNFFINYILIGTVGDENYRRRFLFTMKYFVSFRTYFQSMFLYQADF